MKPYARISFALAESRLVRDSPPVVRAAFMVAKQIISKDYAKISSHTLKIATLWSMADAQNCSQSGVSSENDYSQLDSHQLQRQVEAIFRQLSCERVNVSSGTGLPGLSRTNGR